MIRSTLEFDFVIIDRPPSFLLGYFPFLTVERVIEKCRDVYFPTEDYTDATFIIVNGALLYIFLEDICMSGERSTQDAYKKYAGLCRTNLQTTLAHLNLIMPLRMDSIEALTIAASPDTLMSCMSTYTFIGRSHD